MCVPACTYASGSGLEYVSWILGNPPSFPNDGFISAPFAAECAFIALAAAAVIKLNMRVCMGGMSNFKCALSVRASVCVCQFVCVKSIKRALVSPNELHGKHECVFCLYEEHYWRPLAVEKVKTGSEQDLSPSTLISFSSVLCTAEPICVGSAFSVGRDPEGGNDANSNLFLLCICAVLSELHSTEKKNKRQQKSFSGKTRLWCSQLRIGGLDVFQMKDEEAWKFLATGTHFGRHQLGLPDEPVQVQEEK